MKLRIAVAVIAAVATSAAVMAPVAVAKGRADYKTWPIADVLNDPANAEFLSGFTFKFGGKGSGAATTTRRTDARPFKSDEQRCQRAFLNALIAVRKEAEASGKTSVTGIVTTSTETGDELNSATEYACISGGSNSRVYLNGHMQ